MRRGAAIDLILDRGRENRSRPSAIADGLAELQVRYPNVPIVFCETRKLAEE